MLAPAGAGCPALASAAGERAAIVPYSIVVSTSRMSAARAGFSMTAAIVNPSESPICRAEASTPASNPLISTMAPA